MVAKQTNCDRERLRRLLDGGLPEAAQTAVAEHVETCAACREQLDAFAADPGWWRETREMLSSVDEFPLIDHSGEWASGSDSEVGWDQRRFAAPAHQDSAMPPDGGPALEASWSHPTNDPAHDTTHAIPLDFLAKSDNPAMLGRLGEFEILELIGCGGMGIVLKGYDHELNRYVAVKVLHPHCATSAAARRRFAREAQAAAAVVHQHVVAIHAVDPNHHPPYLVMPFVPGESLQQRLTRQGPFDVIDVLRIGQQVADGLSAAHAQGLVHRDIKPGNILLERNVERVQLTDFGLARAADDASLTQSGVIAGTPQYMSPEQARGEQVDARTDLFSLGTVLYTLLSGHSPFRAETAMGVLRRVCEDAPRPLREAHPNVPAWLDAFVAKLHSKRPADRFESASQVSDLLTNCLAHVQQPNLVPLPDQVASLVKRPLTRGGFWFNVMSHKAAAIVTAVVATALIAAAAVMIGLVNPSLFQWNDTRNDSAQRQPASPATSSNQATPETNWHDTQDAEARDLDQRTRRLEQEDDPW